MAEEDETVSGETPFFWSETDRLVAATYRGFLSASSKADSFSGWSLGLVGAGYALLLSNYSDLPASLQAGSLAVLWWFVAASGFAVLAKIASMATASAGGGSAAVVEEINRLGAEGLDKVDWAAADIAIEKPLWWPLSRVVSKLKTKGVDNLYGLRFSVKAMQLQAHAVGLQLLALLGGAIAFAWTASCYRG